MAASIRLVSLLETWFRLATGRLRRRKDAPLMLMYAQITSRHTYHDDAGRFPDMPVLP